MYQGAFTFCPEGHQPPVKQNQSGLRMSSVQIDQAHQRTWFFISHYTLPLILLKTMRQLFSPFGAAETIYPAENADVVYRLSSDSRRDATILEASK